MKHKVKMFGKNSLSRPFLVLSSLLLINAAIQADETGHAEGTTISVHHMDASLSHEHLGLEQDHDVQEIQIRWCNAIGEQGLFVVSSPTHGPLAFGKVEHWIAWPAILAEYDGLDDSRWLVSLKRRFLGAAMVDDALYLMVWATDAHRASSEGIALIKLDSDGKEMRLEGVSPTFSGDSPPIRPPGNRKEAHPIRAFRFDTGTMFVVGRYRKTYRHLMGLLTGHPAGGNRDFSFIWNGTNVENFSRVQPSGRIHVASSAYVADSNTVHAVWIEEPASPNIRIQPKARILYATADRQGDWGSPVLLAEHPLDDFGPESDLQIDAHGERIAVSWIVRGRKYIIEKAESHWPKEHGYDWPIGGRHHQIAVGSDDRILVGEVSLGRLTIRIRRNERWGEFELPHLENKPVINWHVRPGEKGGFEVLVLSSDDDSSITAHSFVIR